MQTQKHAGGVSVCEVCALFTLPTSSMFTHCQESVGTVSYMISMTAALTEEQHTKPMFTRA